MLIPVFSYLPASDSSSTAGLRVLLTVPGESGLPALHGQALHRPEVRHAAAGVI